MDQITDRVSTLIISQVFPGEGEMAALMRATDWAATPLGPVEAWSPSLRMMVRFLLPNRFPLLLWWGPEFLQIYNDAYRPVLGTKHPQYLGRPVQECWSEIWDVIGPLIETPFNGGPATWMEDILLEVNRHGFVEETHFTIGYSPVPDETAPTGIGGVLATVHEISEKVVGERRMMALRDLGARSSEAKTAEEACQIAAATLAQHPKDVPFALLYLMDADGRHAHLAATAGLVQSSPLGPPVIALADENDAGAGDGWPWPLAEVVRSETMRVVDDLPSRFEDVPPGPWSDAPTSAVVVPIRSNVAHQLAGLLVAGVSARLRLDDIYAGFYDLVSSQIAAAVANARAYEEERRRAEALAAIDRAKTAFFSNVSHEFRTPLTLMLGPLEDLLARGADLPPGEHAELDLIHRNGLRLLKLVNALLDFARIEAGRAQVAYQPTDLAALTADLASAFRSLVERAGLRLVVDCPPLDGALAAPVYVDREMWEKIVLNLLSNAFKHTFAGEIAVALRPAPGGDAVELTVRDTGVGISAGQLPRLFERFHRVQGARSRTHEGSGIGLALVQELVHLHGGTIRAESTEGVGTTFTISLPVGAAHLPAERIAADRTAVSTAVGGAAFVEEARRWLPEVPEEDPDATWLRRDAVDTPEDVLPPAAATGGPPASIARILVADDNADLRDYLRRLLGARYTVEVAANGAAALEAIGRTPPDLVLSDVMMPELDGFGLLRALRSDPRTRAIPIILLSARAGEEATIGGLTAGADDYLVKPFSAREVLARVASHLEIARLHKEAMARVRQLEAIFEAAADGVVIYDQSGSLVQWNAALSTLFEFERVPEYASLPAAERPARLGVHDEHGQPLPLEQLPFMRAARGETLTGAQAMDLNVALPSGREAKVSASAAPLRDEEGQAIGSVVVYRDVTERRRLERESRQQATMLERAHDAIFMWELGGSIVYWNRGAELLYGYRREEAIGRISHDLLQTQHLTTREAFETTLEREGEWTGELIHKTRDGRDIVVLSRHQLLDESDGRRYVLETSRDVTERRALERRTREALEALLELAAAMVSDPADGDTIPHSLALRSVQRRDDVLHRFAALCGRVLACERIAIVTVEPGTGLLRTAAVTGSSPEQERQFRSGFADLRLADRFGAEVAAQLQSGETVLINVASLREDDPARLLSRRLFLVAPMLTAGVLAGYIGVNFGDEADQYAAENRALALAVAQLVGMVMERAHLAREHAEAEAREVALVEANRRMDEFLGIASHELRTPLTSVSANVQMAERGLRTLAAAPPGSQDGKLQRAHNLLERSGRQLRRLDRLVGDLVDVSRIQAGKLELRREPCDLLEIVREAAQEQRAAWPDRTITLDLPRRTALPISADADRIGQVLINYLTNALKYSADDRPVAVRVRALGAAARVEVEDQGPGLSAAQQDGLFERFHRVPGIEQQSGSGVGLGLGLHISREIVQRHGGAVGVASAVGRGSTFWFTLPLAPDAAAPRA